MASYRKDEGKLDPERNQGDADLTCRLGNLVSTAWRATGAVPLVIGLSGIVPFGALAEVIPGGNCQIQPQQIINVSSPAAGILESIDVQENDRVTQGQIVARLESSRQQAKVSRARILAQSEADVLARQTQLELALVQQRRTERRFAADQASEEERDAAEAAARLSRVELERERERKKLTALELDLAIDELDSRILRSGSDGIVTERFYAPGERLVDKPVVSIAVVNPLKVSAQLPGNLFGTVSQGMRARVHTTFPGQSSYTAEVKAVSPFIDSDSNLFEVRLALPNPDYRIPSGTPCRLEILPEQKVAAVAPVESRSNSLKPTGNRPKKTRPSDKPRSGGRNDASGGRKDDYLVLATSSADETTAALLTRLTSQGVTDLAVLKRGPYKGRISLGVYARQRWAEQRQARIAAKGFQSEVVKRMKTGHRRSSSLHSGRIERRNSRADPDPMVSTLLSRKPEN